MLDVQLGTPQQKDFLRVFPLTTPDRIELPYVTLSAALQEGTVRIGEVGGGTVPQLVADNLGELDVLILDGEQLVGARQNRMTNRSIILPAHSKTEIPVSCMEQGRWHFTSDVMRSAPQHSPSKVRRHARKVEADLASRGAIAGREALSQAQGAVWDEIASYSNKLGMRSDTGALDHLYHAESDRLEAWRSAFRLVDHQIGLLVFAGDVPLGLDLIGGAALFAQLHDRLLRGYIMDALADGAPANPANEEAPSAAQGYLDRVRATHRIDAPSVGRGSYRILASTVIGGELIDGDRVAHLSAFPALPNDVGPRGRPQSDLLPPPSLRRRFRS